MKKKHPRPMLIHPYISLLALVESQLGTPKYVAAPEAAPKYPALYRKIRPRPIKKKITPKSEHQTIHPARHLSKNMKIKDIKTAHPSPASSHCQLFLISCIKLERSPWVMELA